MPYDFLLLADGQMRLTVFIRLCPELGRVFTARLCLLVEIIRLLSTLVNEVGSQFQITRILCGMKEFHKCQFDFWVPAVAALFARFAAKGCVNMIGIATQSIQQFALTCCLIMCDRAFDQVSRAI